jgi:4-aminobutyrate aminotransferase/(S)-3-amino-2-methylpropionate transaminase
MTGADLPCVITEVPGPRSRARVDVLARHECPAITARRARRAQAMGVAHDDPLVWDEAVGANVRDMDGNVFVDFTSGFGVAFIGHRHPAVVSAVVEQAQRLPHALGDACPDDTRIRLLELLAALAPGDLEVSVLGLSGSDAIDVAVKTALLATGRRGVLTFTGGYHGLALGTVGLQAYNDSFIEPFRSIAHPEVSHLAWGCPAHDLDKALATQKIGLVLLEPVQGRGGMRTAPAGWVAEVAAMARRYGALVAFDEIYTAFGRSGDWFAGPVEGVVPDLLCVGKALGGGWPISACIGSRTVMDSWGASTGQAIHTQTFLGHPIGCAAALATLDQIAEHDAPGRARALGDQFRVRFAERGFSVTGRGLMLGVPVEDSLSASRELMRRGWMCLPAGMRAEVLAVTPPVCLTDAQLNAFVDAVAAVAAPARASA